MLAQEDVDKVLRLAIEHVFFWLQTEMLQQDQSKVALMSVGTPKPDNIAYWALPACIDRLKGDQGDRHGYPVHNDAAFRIPWHAQQL